MRRSIALLALLTAVVMAPSSLFAFGQNKIVYDKFDWRIYHSTHFDIYFYTSEQESLQKVVNFAESAYDDLSRKFNYQIPKKIPLIFYATHSQFEQTNVELNFIPEGVGAFATSVRNRMVLPIDSPDEELLALIRHELTHIFQYEILFQGRFGQELRISPPTWLIEGMASFFGEDENSKDRMVLRDAVVNDQIPSITRETQGYFAYRFGHSVFQFIVDRWGWDGLRDFIYEYRNTIGSSIEKPLKRAFDITAEDFDTQFRTWLRKQYLPALITKGEPTEFGQPFTVQEDVRSQEMSPAPSPSGDLLAAFTTVKEDVDAVVFNVPKRNLIKNVSPGLPERYEYIIAQGLTTGPVMGRDVAFSPNGDQIAMFVKKERGRALMLVNALSGRIEKIIPMKLEQQLNPTYSPDGRKLAFRAFEGQNSDIFEYNLENGELRNLTRDVYFDAAPVYTPDGASMYYSSVVDGYAKLFKLDVANPAPRYQLTTGPYNDIDAYFSPDGKRLFFASDRQTGRSEAEAGETLEAAENRNKDKTDTPPAEDDKFATYNIYSLDIATGEMLEYTDVVGGSFTPVVFTGEENKEKLVFSSYYKGRWRLYITDTDKPLRPAERVTIPSEPIAPESRTLFVPPVEVAIDPEKIEGREGNKLFVDDVQINAGVASDQTFVSQSVIFMSDMLGDRRFIAALDSVSTFANFNFIYLNLEKRLNWGIRLFDNRTYFLSQDFQTGQIDRQQIYEQTAAMGILSYAFDRYRRIDMGGGYMYRQYNYPVIGPGGGLVYLPHSDNFPLVSATMNGDNTKFRSFGPVSGRRYELTGTYAPDINNGGTVTTDVNLEFRHYRQLTSRSLLAARVFAGVSGGSFPDYYYFGGLNTLRGYDFRTIVGDRAAYANFEIRFPLVDVIATPIIAIGNVRGSLFFDIGGAYFNGQDYNFMDGHTLEDGLASVGYGISFNLFGLELHWDFAKRTNLSTVDDKVVTSFWIGQTF